MTSQAGKNRRAQRFLAILEAMDADSRCSFLKIYRLAPRGNEGSQPAFSGHHVRLAMMEGLRHPGVAYWVRLNLAIRVAKKLCETTGLEERAERLAIVLEDFHVAADAFAYKIPVCQAEANRRRLHGVVSSKPFPRVRKMPSSHPGGLSSEEIDMIQTFKSKMIPGLARGIRQRGLQY